MVLVDTSALSPTSTAAKTQIDSRAPARRIAA
jgi:hypothetical protein